MVYSGESKKVIVSMKPSEHVSDIWLHNEEESTWFLMMFSVIIISSGFTPGWFLPNILHGLKFQ